MPERLPLGFKLNRWLLRGFGDTGASRLLLAAAVGVAAGYGSILFRHLIHAVRALSFPHGSTLAELAATPWWALVAAPAIGGLIVGPLVHFYAQEAKGPGISEVKDACANKGGRIRPRVAIAKILAAGICIGSGGSVGREGPIVQIGASIGSFVGQLLRIRGQHLVDLVASGAAAGIASTFNAPIAGVLFSLEVILGRSSARHFSPLIVSAVIATVVARHHLGNAPAFHVAAATYSLVSAWELALYVVLGALAAVVGVAFTRGLYAVEDLWQRFPLPPYLHAVFGGALVGAMAVVFPQLLGVGYEHIDQVLDIGAGTSANTFSSAGVLIALVAAKILATSITIGSGGSGGVFAPSLFLGASLGGAFGGVAQRLLPAGILASPGAYALVAMGALVAATTHAPLSSMLIVFELTDSYSIILPLMLSCILSTILAMRLCPESIYTLKLVRRGTYTGASPHETEVLRRTQAGTLMAPVDNTVQPDADLLSILELAVETHGSYTYVTNPSRRLLGLITIEDVAIHARDPERERAALTAADLMHPPQCTITPADSLDACLPLLSRQHWEEIPVVDDQQRLIGRLTRDDVMAFISHEVLRRDAVFSFVEERGKDPTSETLSLASGEQKGLILVAGELSGKTLAELDLRVRFGINVYAIRDELGRSTVPDPRRPLAAGDTLVVLGPERQLEHLRELASAKPRP